MTSQLLRAAPTPPGPKGHPLVGVLPEYSRDPLGFLTQWAREYGDAVTLYGFRKAYLFSHPDAIEEILVTQQSHMRKDRLLGIVGKVLGNGLVVSEGDFWRKQRHLMQPAFHRERITAYGNLMIEQTQTLTASWQNGEIRNLGQDMMALTLKVATQAFFGTDVPMAMHEIEQAMLRVQQQFDLRTRHMLLYLLPDPIPTPNNLRYRRAVQELDQLVYRLIEQRRNDPVERGDLLSILLTLRDEAGEGMSNQQLRDEVMTFLLAGHETTALTLTWALTLLSQHPDVETTLLNKLQTVLGERPPTPADLPQLHYTDWVIREAMRLYPPIWAMGRYVASDCEIGGYPITAGSNVVISQYIVHRDPRWFDEPTRFKPERWANDLAKRLPPFAYFPFGGGSRVCIGKAFAMMEAVLVLATLMQQFHLELLPGQEIVPWAAFTLRPKQEIKVRLQRRLA